MSLSFIFSQLSREKVLLMSQFLCIVIVFVSHICLIVRLADGSAKGSRRVRDTRDNFAIVLRGSLSYKVFGHVRKFRESLETNSQIESQSNREPVASQ